jgi:hypothetical protein
VAGSLPPKPTLPAATGECITTTQLPGQAEAAIPKGDLHQVFRAPDGAMRVDAGRTSVITDPNAMKTIVLDHVTKEARVFPMQPQMPSPQQMNPMQLASLAQAPGALNIQDLGKAIIEGQEAEGKRFVLPNPAAATIPPMPQVPGVAPPALPTVPPPGGAVAEIWTHTKLKMPVLTKTVGDFGQQICKCKYQDATMTPPPATMFQVPPDYKVVPVATTAEEAKKLMAAIPGVPQAPGLPQAPAMPQAPALPQVSAPTVPQIPGLPKKS